MMRIVMLCAAALGFVAQTSNGADPKLEEAEALRHALREPTLEYLPLLLKAAQDESHCFPKPGKASLAVSRLGKKAVPEIVARVKSRRNKSWTSQVDNLFLLAHIGPAAEEALPVLEEIEESPKTHKYVRHFACTAKAAIENDVAALTRLAATGPDYGHVALLVIEKLGVEARAAGPAILELARKRLSYERRYLATLEAIDPRLAEDLASEIINR